MNILYILMNEREKNPAEVLAAALTQQNFENVQLHHERGGVFFFTALKEGKHLVVKVAQTPAAGVDRIKNQALANRFLHEHAQSKAVEVPATSFIEHDGYSFAIMDAVAGVAIAESRADGMNEEFTKEDVGSIVSWLAAIRRVPTTEIPEHFRTVAKNDWNMGFYRERLFQNASKPIEQGTLTSDELSHLQTLWAGHYGFITFQHHDVVPFNIMRTPTELALVDGEYARLGMTGYDPAYFAIQTFCLYNRGDLAAEMLEQAIAVWKQEFPMDNLEHSIIAPLAYRIVANLNDGPTQTDENVRERTVRLKSLILTGDIQQIIEGLKT